MIEFARRCLSDSGFNQSTTDTRLPASRERIARAAAVLEGAPPRLLAGRAYYGTSDRRIRAVARPSRHSTAAVNSRTRTFAEAARVLYRGDRS